jgi:hypothetical protein
MEMIKHPCNENCCGDPLIITPYHDEPTDGSLCEECYFLECLNCGDTCRCNL